MKTDVKKKRKFKLSKLFRNTEFILVMSLVISLVIWINMSLSDDNESSTTIINIPVQVQLSEEATKSGLQIFSGGEQTASVTVTGNRVALGNLTPEDIVVSADNAGTITTTGTYPLSLTARKANSGNNFEITSSVSPSVITIYVDHADEATFQLENKITYNVAEGYHSSVALSTDEITIRGPESEVSKISSVAIEGNLSGKLKENREKECEVKLYDYSGKVYWNNMLSLNTDKVTAVFTVQPQKEVPLTVKYKNKPTGLDLTGLVSIEPSSVIVSGSENILNKLESVSLTEIDFSVLKNKKTTLELELDIPKKCTNLSDISTAKVTFDFRNMNSKTLTATLFNVRNLSSEYSYDVTTESLDVVVVGQKGLLKNVKASDISCVIDASGVEGTTGSISLPVEVIINNNDSCWAYGSYTANLSVEKNQ